jgi:hypothetical protein
MRRWNNIERCMERARDEHSLVCAALLAAAFGRLRRGLYGRRNSAAPSRTQTAVYPLLLLAFASVTSFVLPVTAGFAQEVRDMAARPDSRANGMDHALLAGLGLDSATIDSCQDAELLWRAVRELVLPGKLTERTQQRILRKIWAVDPDIADGSWLASDTN